MRSIIEAFFPLCLKGPPSLPQESALAVNVGHRPSPKNNAVKQYKASIKQTKCVVEMEDRFGEFVDTRLLKEVSDGCAKHRKAGRIEYQLAMLLGPRPMTDTSTSTRLMSRAKCHATLVVTTRTLFSSFPSGAYFMWQSHRKPHCERRQ